MEMQAPTVHDLDSVVQALLATGQCLFLLKGDLGSGKTTLVQRFCALVDSRDEVSSPSFSLINEYRYPDRGGMERPVYHIDLYRLDTLQEALDIGILDYMDSGHYCFIEWPDLINPLLPESYVVVELEALEDGTRKIRILIKKDAKLR